MWKLLLAALFCYGIFLYLNSSETSIVLGDHEGWVTTQTSDSILIYIDQHSALAVQEMQRANIPASIILSQAILESRFGTSLLAQHANNHFGIKASSDWNGNDRHCTYTQEWNSYRESAYSTFACFRRYPNIEEGYADHSNFLTTRPWYADLFKLPPTDWQSWAKGLQAAGYATDPQYAAKLISLVKRYRLQRFDQATPLPPSSVSLKNIP